MSARRACTAIVAAAVIGVGAQAPSRPVSRLEASDIRLELYVTADGVPVTDLRAQEIQLLEDGVPQTITSLEHVEPGQRIVVVFLDTFHIAAPAWESIQKPLIGLLDHAIGDNDLVAVVHPRQTVRRVTFGRKDDAIADLLTERWTWADRQRDAPLDPDDRQLFSCYGPGERFEELRARRREKMSLDMVSDVLVRLRGMGPERKAVLLISSGWQLFGPNRRLAGGRGPATECDAERVELAALDHGRRLGALAGDANRANVTFYTLPAGGGSGPRAARLGELATGTDGGIVNPADVRAAARRIVADLKVYYLIGYSATNATADGTFRSLIVRVSRPGVQVRTRSGYRALERMERTPVPAAAPSSPATPAAVVPAAVSGILHRPDEMVNPVNLASLRHVVLWKRGPSSGREYVATEDPRVRRTDRLRIDHATTARGTGIARMLDAEGKPMIVPVQVSERPDPSGNYRWVVAEAVLAPLAPGEYAIELALDQLKVQTYFQVVP